MTYYYRNGMMGGTHEDRSKFFKMLDDIKKRAKSSVTEWQNFYLKTTYELNDGSKAIYLEDTEYGIPYSIEVK